MDKILVIGFGTMGMGIAYLFQKNKYGLKPFLVRIWKRKIFLMKSTINV